MSATLGQLPAILTLVLLCGAMLPAHAKPANEEGNVSLPGIFNLIAFKIMVLMGCVTNSQTQCYYSQVYFLSS